MAKEQALDLKEINARLAGLSGWRYDGKAMARGYKTGGWSMTLMVVNAIGFLCEAAGHHPDLAVSWDRVEVRLWTHSAGGITDKDFETARRIDEAVLWSPPADSALRGPPKPIVTSDPS